MNVGPIHMLASAGFLLIWCIGIVAIFMAIALPFCWREETSDDDGTEEPDDFPEPVDPDMKAWADEVEAMEFDDTFDETDDAGRIVPKWVPVVLVWLFFAPQLPFLLLRILDLLRQWAKPRTYGFGMSWPRNLGAMALLLALLCLYIAILVRTTRRYTQARAVNERTRDGT
jgi:hypothetical protein